LGRAKPAEVKQQSTISDGQQSILDQLITGIQGGEYSQFGQSDQYQQGMGALSNLLGGFDPERTTDAFNQQVANPAMQQFQEEVLPSIQERLISQGAGRGETANRQYAQAGQQLQSNLSGQLAGQLQQGEQQGYQNQLAGINAAPGFANNPQDQQLKAIMQALGVNSFENVQQPGKASLWGPLLSAAGTAGGSALGSLAGPAGTALGAKLGGKLGGAAGNAIGGDSGDINWRALA